MLVLTKEQKRERRQEIAWLRRRIEETEGLVIEPWQRRLVKMYRHRLARMLPSNSSCT
jgi:hypothetical protein